MMPEPGKYGVILADPNWNTVTWGKARALPQRAEGQHYATATLDELKALPVREFAAKDCALFMWVMGSHLDQALALGKAWGFTFRTDALIWIKETKNGRQLDLFTGESEPKMGMGKWSRKGAEQCWLFTRGRPRRLNADVRQVIRAPVREHSRKPDEQYERIERLVAGPRIELFSRTNREGWDVAYSDQAGMFEAPIA
jgi:N6-adenosine-specific RNA methylase IME4